MHHFEIKKIINFLGRGTAPPQTLPLSPPTAPRFSRLGRSTCDPPNAAVALTPVKPSSPRVVKEVREGLTGSVTIIDQQRPYARRGRKR